MSLRPAFLLPLSLSIKIAFFTAMFFVSVVRFACPAVYIFLSERRVRIEIEQTGASSKLRNRRSGSSGSWERLRRRETLPSDAVALCPTAARRGGSLPLTWLCNASCSNHGRG